MYECRIVLPDCSSVLPPSADLVLLEAALSACDSLEAERAEAARWRALEAADEARQARGDAARRVQAKDAELRRLADRVASLEATLERTAAAHARTLRGRDVLLQRVLADAAAAELGGAAELGRLRAERAAVVSTAAEAARREGAAMSDRRVCVELYLRATTVHARFKAAACRAATALAKITAAPVPSRQSYLDAKRELTSVPFHGGDPDCGACAGRGTSPNAPFAETGGGHRSLQTCIVADDRGKAMLDDLYAQHHLSDVATDEPAAPRSPRRPQSANPAKPVSRMGARRPQSAAPSSSRSPAAPAWWGAGAWDVPARPGETPDVPLPTAALPGAAEDRRNVGPMIQQTPSGRWEPSAQHRRPQQRPASAAPMVQRSPCRIPY
ncbi:hypothetical protein M885DRAFT_531416 [Pelagophyceae sp. CCMP2097]|nr:hypothetical protein M885DRAFT_531416 [Pelagophyceae sp. CCMP2097]